MIDPKLGVRIITRDVWDMRRTWHLLLPPGGQVLPGRPLVILRARSISVLPVDSAIFTMNSPAALLPAGWREVAGSSNSSSYYTNTVTGHSQKQRPVQQQRHRCFPDPDPLPLQEGPSADDVSGFNGMFLPYYQLATSSSLSPFFVQPDRSHKQPRLSPASSCQDAKRRSFPQASFTLHYPSAATS